jgi:archaellin
MRISVNVSQLTTLLGEDVRFTIEVKPNRGSTLIVERFTPSGIDDVTYTN